MIWKCPSSRSGNASRPSVFSVDNQQPGVGIGSAAATPCSRSRPRPGLWLRAGDVIEISTGGGGGFGDPFKRDIRQVADDLRDRFVSRLAAAEDYGVEFDAHGKVDLEPTLRRRADRTTSPIRSVEVRDIVDSPRDSIVIGRDELGDLNVVERQVVYCFSDRCAVYLRAILRAGTGCEIGPAVADALLVGVGQRIEVRVLPTVSEPYQTDELRKMFRRHRERERRVS